MYTVPCTDVYCTVYRCILYRVHLYTVPCTSVYCTVYICILYRVQMYTVPCTDVYCTVYISNMPSNPAAHIAHHTPTTTSNNDALSLGNVTLRYVYMNNNQHNALFIFSLLSYHTSTCFGRISSLSSGGRMYKCGKWHLL
jgi:hypothetical protein